MLLWCGVVWFLVGCCGGVFFGFVVVVVLSFFTVSSSSSSKYLAFKILGPGKNKPLKTLS